MVWGDVEAGGREGGGRERGGSERSERWGVGEGGLEDDVR